MPATLKSRFPFIIGEMRPRISAALATSAEAIAEGAKARVHVESGSLRDSIHVEADPPGYRVVAGDDDVFYGHFEEFGTVDTPAHPFLLPAAEEEVAPTIARVTTVLRTL